MEFKKIQPTNRKIPRIPSKYVYKMQVHLRPFYNILRQQNNFEWTTEHQTRFDEIKKLITEQISKPFQIEINHSKQCAMLQILASAQHYSIT